jgi:hypothetical protein
MDYGAWFNHFFEEAKGSQTNAAAALMYAGIFSLIFDYDVDGAGNCAKLKATAGRCSTAHSERAPKAGSIHSVGA